ncbi:uncharacterized protein LOC136032058 [Artemia franciscana]|uniref:TAR DNA-binding protein 43 N-terminal domain-containing protein n=1 Tax=Artemia franciscana TaxID=6661 RepID=A0AA88LC10_ARTSF|nr:hypothetical protein QYM36_000340 [Artemia franciscana]
MDYICIKSPNSRGTIELPLEDDGSLLLTTLTSQFPDATGLTFYCESAQATRGLKLSEGKLWPPRGGWSNTIYSCTTNKGMFIRVSERILFNDGYNLGCILDGLTDDQMYRLCGILNRKFSGNNITQHNILDSVSFGQHMVLNIRAMELMSFLKKEYKAKIINFDNLYGTIHLPPEVRGGSPIGTVIWTLELDEI